MSDHVEGIGSGGGGGSMDLSRCFLMYANLTRAYVCVCVCGGNARATIAYDGKT